MMHRLVQLLLWGVRVGFFLLLLAFALNNPHEVTLYGLFGFQWQTPMILLVLVVFSLGLVSGLLAMTPRWWRNRKL
jgi:lipopolysaccharide assembly protein A